MDAYDLHRLLDPSPLPLETGYERLSNGVLHVACRTDLHGCTGTMFDWWFHSRPDTARYIWWHPVDHISSVWEAGQDGSLAGATHIVEERLTDLPAMKLSIQFWDPGEFFGEAALSSAREAGHLHALVSGRICESHAPMKTDDGKILGGRLFHLARDTEWGVALRSHFFLGTDLAAAGVSSQEVERVAPGAIGPALLAHCYNEFTFLCRFLPSLFAAENRDAIQIRVPW